MNNPRTNIITQIRMKQLGIQAWQNDLIKKIGEKHEDLHDVSGEKLTKDMLGHLESLSTRFNDSLTELKESTLSDANILGFPIKFNKTSLQLKMAEDYLLSHYVNQGSGNLLPDLIVKKLYNGLDNKMIEDELPILGSSNLTNFWGNENSSVSSVLLVNVASYLEIKIPQFGGCTFFPLIDSSYKLGLQETNPFISKDGLLLFGDYQFGGHRYFSEQKIFGPEDCSSSVGKSIGLTPEQLKSFSTTSLKNIYTDNKKEFDLTPVTSSSSLNVFNPSSIQAGDIIVFSSHTAIINKKSNDKIHTLEFNRDIDTLTDKKLGGGTYQYEIDSLLTNADRPLYVLRNEVVDNHIEFSEQELIQKIDFKFQEKFPDGAIEDLSGYCGDLYNEL